MTSILLIVIAALLIVIGLFVHAGNAFGTQLGRAFTWLTTRMGPGVTYRAEKVFPTQVVWYTLAALSLVTAIVLRVKGYK